MSYTQTEIKTVCNKSECYVIIRVTNFCLFLRFVLIFKSNGLQNGNALFVGNVIIFYYRA